MRSSADTLKIGVEIATQTETKWFGSKTQEIGVENVAQINGRRDFWTVVEQVCAKMSLGVPVSLECRSSMERTRVVEFSGRRGILN